MQIKYIAEDGKEFDDEYACRDYEEELWLKQCNPEIDILFFDDDRGLLFQVLLICLDNVNGILNVFNK